MINAECIVADIHAVMATVWLKAKYGSDALTRAFFSLHGEEGLDATTDLTTQLATRILTQMAEILEGIVKDQGQDQQPCECVICNSVDRIFSRVQGGMAAVWLKQKYGSAEKAKQQDPMEGIGATRSCAVSVTNDILNLLHCSQSATEDSISTHSATLQ